MTRNPRLRGFTLLSLVLAVICLGPISSSADKGSSHSVQFGTPVPGDSWGNKVSPGLRRMIVDYNRAISDGPGSIAMRRLYDGSMYFRLQQGDGMNAPMVQTLIAVSDASALGSLRQLGVVVDAVSGDILVARIPLTAVSEIAAMESVQKIEISGWSYPLLNQSRVEAKVDQVHNGAAGQPYKGAGAVVGVLDSGIDFAHPDFNIAPGNTRILGILDFGNAGQSGNPTEFTKAQIDAGQCTEVDGTGAHGHGTHVTGIAAGGGRQNAAYIGMAPEADIFFVKGIRDPQSNGGFSNNDVIQGVQWIFGKADALRKPCVINLSLGGHFGPHDGSSLYEQALSSMVKPGKIIVAAAGNEGADLIHTSFTASGTNYATAPEALWIMPQGATTSYVDMWYPHANTMSVGIGVYIVSQGQLVPLAHTTEVIPGNQIQNVQISDQGGTVLGTVSVDATTTQDPNNGAREVLFTVQGNDISNYIWTIYAYGNGTLDAWTLASGQFYPPVTGLDPLYKFGDNDKSVGSPGTAAKIVCVGAYVTKNQWVDINGTTQQELNPGNPNPVVPAIGQLAYFSSHGPTRDGRTKPDLVAPGEVIMSSLSSGFTTVPAEYVLQGGGLQKQQGTSQASPHITGIVALLLQKNKYLTYENVVSVLKATAVAPANPPANSVNLWGSGKVNALAAMSAIPPAVDCATLARLTGYDCEGNRVLQYELMSPYPNPFNPSTTIAFRIAKQEMVELSIFDVLGRHIRTITRDVLPEGFHSVVWDGADDQGRVVSSGVYYSRLATAGYTSTNKLLMMK